jgi:antitoxin component of RelBE/YafQ-DinJ toxin-antitoxin module
MNLTLSIEDELLEKARKRAAEMGTTVNQYVRDTLRNFVGEDDIEAELAFFKQTSGKGKPDADWKFNREEMYDERFRSYGQS